MEQILLDIITLFQKWCTPLPLSRDARSPLPKQGKTIIVL